MIQYTAIILFVLGIYGLLTQKNVIKMIVSLNIMELGLNIFIVSIGYVTDGHAPIVSSVDELAMVFVDPLPQALVLTAIVIGLGTTALGLAVAFKVFQKYHTLDIEEMEELV